MKILLPLLLFGFLISSPKVFSQYVQETNQSVDTSKIVLVTLKSGEEFIGTIVKQDANGIELKTEKFGVIPLKWVDISSIEDVNPEEVTKGGKLYTHNLQSTRYFFGPNGFGLKEGEGYYQNVWIFFNQASYGITDYFSLSAGVVPTFLFAGAPTPVWIVPKISIPVVKDVINVGAGALLGTVIGAENASFGIAFGNFTVGNTNTNLTVSLGYGMINGEWSSSPVVTVSGMARVSRKTYLITENYFFPKEVGVSLISFGARSFAGKIGIDYGLVSPIVVSPIGADTFFAIPWLGLTVPFGNYKR